MADTKAKVERALYGPSVTEVVVGAALSLVLGAALAVIYLAWKPVETVRELPEEPVSGVVYYVPGSTNAAKGRQYLRKRQLLLEGGAGETIRLSEEELNAWIASSRANPEAAAGGGMVDPQSINFRIRDGLFQIGLPCTVSVFGLNHPLILQARGGFESNGEVYVFSPDELHLGSLAAHRVPGLGALVRSRLLNMQNVPDELRNAWRRLAHVEVEDDQLVLTLP